MLRRSAAALVVSALGALGCSDAVEPPSQGNLIISISSSADAPAGSQCPSIGHTKNIGTTPPTTTVAGSRVVDGEGGAQVFCSVSGGEPASFNGKINQGNISFSMKGTASPGGTGTGTIIYYDNQVATTLESPADKPCTIAVNEGALQIADGRIWAKFDCPLMFDAPSAACKASGIFVMENCE